MSTATQEKLSFQAEVKQLLHIVVHSLYSNKEIFLRELIANASDAIDKIRFAALSHPDIYDNDTDLAIRINFDKEAKTITISDNGIGMNREEVINNLGTIAKSGTREFLSQLTGDQKKDATLIGQFGVGFYSAFMVADKVTVLTRRPEAKHHEGVCWESRGDGEYTLNVVEKTSRGTDIILQLKETENDFLNALRLRHIVTKYSDHLNVPILMPVQTEDEKNTAEWETINRATALWTLPKNSVTDEQYHEFYKHITHDFSEPLAFTHHKIEGGQIDYTCLLYVPSHAPFDFWQRDAQYGLKLHVQRVFIMDEVEQFLPHYLRFVRGVIDTTALPLNISREILQDHHSIPKLRSALVRHILDLLERIATNEPEKYQTVWREFGNVLKEGPAEDFVNRARIAGLLRFASTQQDAQTVSLNDYVKRMPETQKKIYYITAENINAAKSSPHLEIFRKNNIEVLLLTDRIDEWLVAHLSEFEGKALQSVAKGELPLDEITQAENESKTENSTPKELEALLEKIKTLLADKVKEVRLSKRLTTSPACLVRDQDALGPQMERLLKAAGQEVTAVKPSLELNAEHTIIRKLAMGLPDEKLNEWVYVLFEQALLAEGSPLPDPAAFVQRINKLWMESLC